MEGVPNTIIAKMTGHASRVMERYKHLSPSFKQQSVELIAGQLGKHLSRRISQGTKKGTMPKKAKPSAGARTTSKPSKKTGAFKRSARSSATIAPLCTPTAASKASKT
jgi:hypothetical protein